MEPLTDDQIKGLKSLMEPFDKAEISKLPKPTKAQTDEVRQDFKKGIRCDICGGWHHPKVVHLDYVGHAALTKRLLDVDPLWNWEPFAVNEIGEPRLDDYGGMWGWLTVCGVTRRGYGDAEGKTGSNANKERIGDFLRNAAMRFGAALDLWSKADLTKFGIADDFQPPEKNGKKPPPQTERKPGDGGETAPDRKAVEQWLAWIDNHVKVNRADASAILEKGWKGNLEPNLKGFPADQQNELQIAYKDTMRLLTEREGAKENG